MIEFGKYRMAIAVAITETSISGSTALKSWTISNAKTMNANVAREADPNTAAMATRAHAPGDKCAPGIKVLTPIEKRPPAAADDMNIGASSPPEVPDPKESNNATDLHTATSARSFN